MGISPNVIWWIIVGLVLTIVFWGGFIAFIVWWKNRMTQSKDKHPPASRPLDIARERYARGEISQTEFEQIKRDLS